MALYAALNWRKEYMEYITNYPIAEYRIVDEMANNPSLKEFMEVRLRFVICVEQVCWLTLVLVIASNARTIRTST